jgi:hypothetical protein
MGQSGPVKWPPGQGPARQVHLGLAGVFVLDFKTVGHTAGDMTNWYMRDACVCSLSPTT